MEPVSQILLDAWNRPDTKPFLFQVGQKVRLRKGRSDDGQTEPFWDGAMVEIVQQKCTGFMKYHYYKVRHLENRWTCDFEEDEIDMRYAKKVKNELS